MTRKKKRHAELVKLLRSIESDIVILKVRLDALDRAVRAIDCGRCHYEAPQMVGPPLGRYAS